MSPFREREALFGQFFDQVYAYVAYRILPDWAAAEDITQEVFLAAFRAALRDRDDASALSWLRGIARNKVADHFRRRGIVVPQAVVQAELCAAATPDCSESQRRALLVAQALRSLPDDAVGLSRQQSFLDVCMLLLNTLQKQWPKAQLTQERRTIDDKAYTVFRLASPEKDACYIEIRIDPTAERVVRMAARTPGLAEPKPQTMDLDYPQAGPADLYALGVPRDAKVLDLTPPKVVEELDKKVSAAIEAFAPSYYAIICTVPDLEPTLPQMSVVYKKNGRYRMDDGYGVDPNTDGAMPVADAAAMEVIAHQRRATYHRFVLDRQSGVLLKIWNGKLTKKQFHEIDLGGTIEGLAWRSQWTAPRYDMDNGDRRSIVATAASAAAGTVTREETTQAWASGGSWMPASRQRDTYDPSRDYIWCQSDRLWTYQADWQLDKRVVDRLKGDAGMMRYRLQESRAVLEYGRTPRGQWYPKKLHTELEQTGSDRPASARESDMPRYGQTIWIHLDTTRDIPDSLMDPQSVERELAEKAASRPATLPSAAPRW